MDRQSRLQDQHSRFISASEACDLLDVKPGTLYTYVSRGLIRRIAIGERRGSRYALSDVMVLRSRADARAGHGPAAADALNWGQPIIQSSISTVGADAGLTYRDHSVLELVQQKVQFESVAELLWCGELPQRKPTWPAPAMEFPVGLETLSKNASPYNVVATILPLLAERDSERLAMTPEVEHERARRLIRMVAASVALPESKSRAQEALSKPSVPVALATALGLPARASTHINTMLVLCAEHELNTSTFAARVASSARADLYSCLSAAVATFSGVRLGLVLERILALLEEVKEEGDATAVLQARLERGETIPGFGQKLYPNGDPRAVPLILAAREIAVKSSDLRSLFKIVRAAKAIGYYSPHLDMGIAMMSMALGIPKGKAYSLFMIGRFAGWIAHILEQRTQPALLRPRADYPAQTPEGT